MGYYVTETMTGLTAEGATARFSAWRKKKGLGAPFLQAILSTKYCDGDLGLYYYGFRYYSPGLGRWLSKDPIGTRGGLNVYAFVSNRPVLGVDRLGLSSVWDIILPWRWSSSKDGTDKRTKDCVFWVRAAHGVSGDKSNVDHILSQDFSKLPCGDRVGYWGCGAGAMNDWIDDRFPGVILPVPLPQPGEPYPEDVIQTLIRRGIPEDVARKMLTISSADIISDLNSIWEMLDREANTECDRDGSCCKTVTIRLDCQDEVIATELSQGLLPQDVVFREADQFFGTVGSTSRKWHDFEKYLLAKYKGKYADKFICGKEKTIDCGKK